MVFVVNKEFEVKLLYMDGWEVCCFCSWSNWEVKFVDLGFDILLGVYFFDVGCVDMVVGIWVKVDDVVLYGCFWVVIDVGVKILGFLIGGGMFVLKRLFKIVCLFNLFGLFIGFFLGC